MSVEHNSLFVVGQFAINLYILQCYYNLIFKIGDALSGLNPFEIWMYLSITINLQAYLLS